MADESSIFLKKMSHHLLKTEHAIGIVIFGWLVVVIGMMTVEEFDDVETATIDIEMNVALLEIGGNCFPNPDFGVHLLDGLPRCETYTSAVDMGRDEKQFEVARMGVGVQVYHYASHLLAVAYDSVSLGTRGVDSVADGLLGNDLTILLEVIITHSKLLRSSIKEGFLVVGDELLAVIFLQRQ